MPSPAGVRTWTRIVPGLASDAGRRERRGAVADDPGHGRDGLDVVDDGRQVEQAALGRVRRPLLGLAALALEGLEQDGLLAQHVGALDRSDRDLDVVAGAEDVEADEAGLRRPPRWPPRAARIASVASARTAMMTSRGADREGRDRGTLDDRERVALEQEAVRARRRVRAVAVDHDVAAGRVGGRPPCATWRRPGSRPRRARADPTRRSWRSSRSRRASRMARRRPSKAPARVAASRSVGSAAPARSSRIVGQARGVLSRSVMPSRARRRAGRAGAPAVDRSCRLAATATRRSAPSPGRSGRSPRTAGARPSPRPGRSPSRGSKRRWL